MDISQLLLLQFIAHLLADYTFQTDKKAIDKNKKGFKSKFLKWHILLVFLLSWLLSFQLKFVFASLLIALTHWVIDGFKPKLNKSKVVGKYTFFIDQFLHIFILVLVSYIYFYKIGVDAVLIKIPTKYLLFFLAFYLTAKPTNILIRETFKLFNIKFEKAKNELLNAGKLIGILERWLILLFIFLDQYEAIGFLIASKSILRYNPKPDENDFNKTEYVLVGTLLSFFIAILTGTLLLNLLKIIGEY